MHVPGEAPGNTLKRLAAYLGHPPPSISLELNRTGQTPKKRRCERKRAATMSKIGVRIGKVHFFTYKKSEYLENLWSNLEKLDVNHFLFKFYIYIIPNFLRNRGNFFSKKYYLNFGKNFHHFEKKTCF